MATPHINVVDFFSGCGGTSCGFQNAGMNVLLGLDHDSDSGDTFRLNFPSASFLKADLQTLPVENLFDSKVRPLDGYLLFSGCAPCQPFTKQRTDRRGNDERRTLLSTFEKFIAHWLPDLVFVENVPGLQKVDRKPGPFAGFLKMLKKLGYFTDYAVVRASDYGVPQRRERLVLMASRIGSVALPRPSHGLDGKKLAVVRDWISALPPLSAGETDANDPDHRAAALSDLNLARIRATTEGGGRENWPESLLLNCHRGHVGHSDVYGRLSWTKPASALTTRCVSYSNGRFGHPEQDRAISLREAACLQTFPRTWQFSGSLESRARQVGNAVPPLMAEAIGREFVRHVSMHDEQTTFKDLKCESLFRHYGS